MKKSLSLFFVFSLMFIFSLNSYAAKLTDVGDHWAEADIERLREDKIINGYPDNTYKPNELITRAEFVKMIVELFESTQTADLSSYTDIPLDSWYYDYFAKAVAMGAVKGYNTSIMKPEAKITRQEAIVILHRIIKLSFSEEKTEIVFADSEDIASWAEDAITALVHVGVINGYEDGSIKPTSFISRAECAKIISKSVGKIIKKSGAYDLSGVEGVVIVKAENVTLTNVEESRVIPTKESIRESLTIEEKDEAKLPAIDEKKSEHQKSNNSKTNSNNTKIEIETETENETENSDINLQDEEVQEMIANGYVTPELFGAVGDGETDDYAAFSDAVKYGNVILDEKKVYRIADTIVLMNDINIHGNGATVICDGDKKYWLYSDGNDIHIEETNFVKCGENTNLNRCIRGDSVENMSVLDCTFKGFGTAVHDNEGTYFEATNVSVYEAFGVDSQYGYGINTSAVYNTITQLRGSNESCDTGRHLIYLNGDIMKSATVTDVYCKNWYREPIQYAASNSTGADIKLLNITFDTVNIDPSDAKNHYNGAIVATNEAIGQLFITGYTNINCKSAVLSSQSPNVKVFLDDANITCTESTFSKIQLIYFRHSPKCLVKNTKITDRSPETFIYTIYFRDCTIRYS